MNAKRVSTGNSNKNVNAAACYMFSELPVLPGRKPIGQIPYFSGLLAEVAHTGFSGLSPLFDCMRKDGQLQLVCQQVVVAFARHLLISVGCKHYKALMPRISKLNSQENHHTKTFEEESSVSTQETGARKDWEMGSVYKVHWQIGPMVPIHKSSTNLREAFSIIIYL
jgi:hypothetical protein